MLESSIYKTLRLIAKGLFPNELHSKTADFLVEAHRLGFSLHVGFYARLDDVYADVCNPKFN